MANINKCFFRKWGISKYEALWHCSGRKPSSPALKFKLPSKWCQISKVTTNLLEKKKGNDKIREISNFKKAKLSNFLYQLEIYKNIKEEYTKMTKTCSFKSQKMTILKSSQVLQTFVPKIPSNEWLGNKYLRINFVIYRTFKMYS